MAETAMNDTRAKAEGGEKPLSASFWHNELKAAEKREKAWRKRAQNVVDRYRDERDRDDDSERRTNILWSNTEVLKSILFQGIGNPDVRRRHPKKGKADRAARQCALALENALAYCRDDYDADAQVEFAVEDHLLAGRGQCWVVYDAEVTEEAPEDETDDAAEPVATGIESQSVYFEHVYWEHYRTSAGRKENDIWWKARLHQYTRDELKRYFPEHADKISLDAEILDRPDQGKEDEETFKRANVWEIWDKSKLERVYVADGYPSILRKDDDPYKLKEFYPCPSALYGCKTTSSLIPVPEYTLYQDQAEELDKITTRLSRLIDALRRRGVYDAGAEGGDGQLAALAHAGDNEFIPYRGFASLLEKGGLKNAFQTEDLTPIIAVVERLYEQRMNLVQTIYEVTGISDVIRGSTNPNETATAQRGKLQFGSLRVNKRKSRVDAFVRDLFRIKAEIMAEHFERDKLVEMSGIIMPTQQEQMQAKQQLAQYQQMMQQAQMAQQQAQMASQGQQQGMPPQQIPQPQPAQPPQMDPDMLQELQDTVKAVSWEEIEAILRSDDRRGYSIDIETEDTAQADEQADKESRIEFLNTMMQVVANIVPAMQASPQLAPLVKEIIGFTVKGFKVGRTLEEAFSDALDKIAEAPPQAPQVDPATAAKAEQIKAQTQMAMEKGKADIAIKQQGMQADMAMKKMDIQGKQMELGMKQQEAQADMQIKAQGNQMKLAEMKQKHDMNRASTVMDFEAKRQQMRHAEEAAQRDAMIPPGGA